MDIEKKVEDVISFKNLVHIFKELRIKELNTLNAEIAKKRADFEAKFLVKLHLENPICELVNKPRNLECCGMAIDLYNQAVVLFGLNPQVYPPRQNF